MLLLLILVSDHVTDLQTSSPSTVHHASRFRCSVRDLVSMDKVEYGCAVCRGIPNKPVCQECVNKKTTQSFGEIAALQRSLLLNKLEQKMQNKVTHKSLLPFLSLDRQGSLTMLPQYLASSQQLQLGVRLSSLQATTKRAAAISDQLDRGEYAWSSAVLTCSIYG